MAVLVSRANATRALNCWDLVIERNDQACSRFPLDQALMYRYEAQKMLGEARRGVAAVALSNSKTFQATSTQAQDGRFRLRIKATPKLVSKKRLSVQAAGSSRSQDGVSTPLRDVTNRMPSRRESNNAAIKVRDFAVERADGEDGQE